MHFNCIALIGLLCCLSQQELNIEQQVYNFTIDQLLTSPVRDDRDDYSVSLIG